MSDLRSTPDYATGLYRIVRCPVCGEETMDCFWVCENCYWEYDGTTDPDAYSDVNRMTLREYRNRFAAKRRKEPESATRPTAWMLRGDGAEFPCVCHYYGNSDDYEETAHAAEWLYQATVHANVRQLVLDFLYAYGASLKPKQNAVRNLLSAIRKQSCTGLSRDFIAQHISEFRPVEANKLASLNGEVNRALNGEFTRVRLGGMYDTQPGNRDLYFRISDDSSEKSVLLRLVRNFVEKHADDVETVTVLWDKESTGHSEFWCDETGKALNHMSLVLFWGKETS